MNGDKPLSALYEQYVARNLSRRDFEGRIFKYLLDNYERFRVFKGNEDRWKEYLSWLYPRFSRAIDLYRDVGASFDAYITSLVHNAAKEYRCREADHYMTEYTCWQARAEEMTLLETEPEYYEFRKDVSIPDGINPRQVLFLLLKSYFWVTDEFVEKVAATIGMKASEIKNMVRELREKRSRKETEIFELRERVHCQHYRCLTYEKRMAGVQPGTVHYERLKGRFERAKKRFYTMKKRLGGMRLAPSNRMIAEVMGIPQGTVDSGLFTIKSRISRFTALEDNQRPEACPREGRPDEKTG